MQIFSIAICYLPQQYLHRIQLQFNIIFLLARIKNQDIAPGPHSCTWDCIIVSRVSTIIVTCGGHVMRMFLVLHVSTGSPEVHCWGEIIGTSSDNSTDDIWLCFKTVSVCFMITLLSLNVIFYDLRCAGCWPSLECCDQWSRETMISSWSLTHSSRTHQLHNLAPLQPY